MGTKIPCSILVQTSTGHCKINSIELLVSEIEFRIAKHLASRFLQTFSGKFKQLLSCLRFMEVGKVSKDHKFLLSSSLIGSLIGPLK